MAGKQQAVQVNFPKKFKEVYAVIPDFNRIYKHSNISIKFRPKIGAGTNIECGSFNQTGTTITALLQASLAASSHAKLDRSR